MTNRATRHGTCRIRGRYLLGAAMAAAVLAPGLQAQSVASDSDQAAESPFRLLAGARVEYYGLVSPGASFQVNWEPPSQRGAWLGMQLHAQVIRFKAAEDAVNAYRTRRDYHFAARFRAGFGRGDGPIFYGFAEGGIGMIGTEPEAKRGETYTLSGAGIGVGLTLLPVSFTVEGTLGRADRPSSELMDSFVMALSYYIR